MALTSGTRVGTYQVIALIGAGGMGEVYRARDTRLNRDVALTLPDQHRAGASGVSADHGGGELDGGAGEIEVRGAKWEVGPKAPGAATAPGAPTGSRSWRLAGKQEKAACPHKLR
jgi:hypothetical protein